MSGPTSGQILGCVLAGGLSRRMGGGDKALIEIGGEPMLSRVIRRLRPQVGWPILNANGDPVRFTTFELPVVADTVEGFTGPLAGVLAAMRYAEDEHPAATHVATVAADTPFFPDDLVARLAEKAADDDTVVLATSGGNRHPVFGLWPVALADDLEEWLLATDTFKVLAWIGRHRLETVDFAFVETGTAPVDPFFNANTPDDIVEAERLIRELNA
jgi:molybdopterin-guanine dinucleotide biosynthesis protein A